MTTINPYDELPYRSLPIEWTAPERLAVASLLHGGPRAPLDTYRVLEIGCGNGANLLPLAFYRRQGNFVGVDGACSQIEIAEARKSELKLSSIDFICADFLTAAKQLSGQFDYIIAHGIFSWVSHDVRDALLGLCAERLSRGGLLYLNYNTRPGWNIRGMVREFLLAQTAGIASLLDRARAAQVVAAKVVESLRVGEHPYSQ
ncbi:MAG: class I SAM-dependent methyltransferase, partial [Nitrospirota bacterium]